MSMDFSGMGFSRVEGDFNDVNNPTRMTRNLIIEIVVIDQTNPTETAYQLKKDSPFTDEELKQIKKGIINIPHDAFMPLGVVESINKHSKQIILSDQNTVTYSYLITVTGKKPTILSYEFLAGLHTLVDALRVNKTLTNNLIPAKVTTHKIDVNITISDEHNERIENLGNHKMSTKRPEQATVLVSELNKKLFQIQI